MMYLIMSIQQCTVNIPIVGGFSFSDKINSLSSDDIGWLAFYKFIAKASMMMIGVVFSAVIFQLRMNLSENEMLSWIRPKINTEPVAWVYGFVPALVLFTGGALVYVYCTRVVSTLQTGIMKKITAANTRPCKDSTGYVWTADNTIWQTLFAI